MIFIKQLNLLKKMFVFLALFNLYISFDNITYITAKVMDTFVFSQAKMANLHVYHNYTKILLLTFIDHIKTKD